MANQHVIVPGAGTAELPGARLGWRHKSFRRLFSMSAFLLAARFAGAGAGFLVQLILARYLSAHDLGVYFTATSLAVIGGVIAAHGYPSIATRFVSRYRKPSGWSLLRAFVRRAQIEALIFAVAIMAIVAAAAAAWPDLRGETRMTILVAAAMIPFVASFRLHGSLAVATRSFPLAYLPDVCLKPTILLGALGAILYFAGRLTLAEVMISLTAATVVLSAAQYLLLARSFPVDITLWHRHVQRPSSFGIVASRWRREAHAVLLVAIVAQFFPELTILISTPTLQPAEIGVFGLCLKLAFLIGFFVQVTQNIATPDLADALARRSARQDAKVTSPCTAATAVTLPAVLLALLFGDDFLRLFGAEFEAGHTALVLMVAAQLVYAMFGPTTAVLTLVGERKANLILAIAASAVLSVSLAVLGARFGLNGAASAVLLTMFFWSASSAWMLHRRTGIRVDLFAAFLTSGRAPAVN